LLKSFIGWDFQFNCVSMESLLTIISFLIDDRSLDLVVRLYNMSGFRTETMYDNYIVMKSMFLVVKLSSHLIIGYASLAIFLSWTTHKQHQNYSKTKNFSINQNFNSQTLYSYYNFVQKWRCFSRSQTLPYILTKRKLLKKFPKTYSPHDSPNNQKETTSHGSPCDSTIDHKKTTSHGSPCDSTIDHKKTTSHGSPCDFTINHKKTTSHGFPMWFHN